MQSVDFDNTAHPARRLFERMLMPVSAGSVKDNLRAGIYPQLQRIVTQILKHETLEDSFFGEKITELDKAEAEARTAVVRGRGTHLEGRAAGRASSKAKAIVKKTIDDIGGDSGGRADRGSPSCRRPLPTTSPCCCCAVTSIPEITGLGQRLQRRRTAGRGCGVRNQGRPLGEDTRADLTRRLETSVCSLIPHHEENIRRVVNALDAAAESRHRYHAGRRPKAQVGTATRWQRR